MRFRNTWRNREAEAVGLERPVQLRAFPAYCESAGAHRRTGRAVRFRPGTQGRKRPSCVTAPSRQSTMRAPAGCQVVGVGHGRGERLAFNSLLDGRHGRI